MNPVTPLPSITIIPNSTTLVFTAISGNEITDDLLNSCANLFSANYGIWGPGAATISKYTKPGERVKITGSKLRTQFVCPPEKTVLVTCIQVDPTLGITSGRLIGHAFTSVWDYIPSGGDPANRTSELVGWVTQLVVDKSFRRRYIATQLLQTLKSNPLFASATVVGLASSHPAACNVLAKYASANLYDVDLAFIRDHAEGILASSSASYLKAAQVRGSLFQADCDSGAVSSAFTSFYVDHDEPLKVLKRYEAKGQWSLGELLDGHEFLAIFPVAPLKPIRL